MGWEDRRYASRDSRGGASGDPVRWLASIFSRTFPLGSFQGIRVEAHILLLLLLVTELLQAGTWWPVALRSFALLFGSVLLHEFGHAIACRRSGGQADHIILWPLGGLAMCNPPPRIGAHFATVAAGPMVNLVIAVAAWATLTAYQQALPAFRPFTELVPVHIGLWGALYDLMHINVQLLAFNVLLPFYPFDGGRLVQIALWRWMGFRRSLEASAKLGMAGGIGIGIFGIATGHIGLVLIAAFGYFQCQQELQRLAYEDAAYGEAVYTAADAAPRKPGPFARWRRQSELRRQQHQQQLEAQLDQQIDHILAKIKEKGMGSLTRAEKKLLQQATETRRRGL